MSNVTKFPGFNRRPGVLAIPAQMTERIQEAKDGGLEVHVVAMVAVKQPSGFFMYHPYWDTQPREIMGWAARELYNYAEAFEDADPDPPAPGAA